ncbi:hypothetical protein AB0J83_37405 [Actinoplanes sp. NPDC049596]|uniref:NucA/NucB deoxyribonuclease domain-containing protein n=1 Tax=unclassified Actinoplanes TaxID=2626549 RepID=UPI0034219D1C
MFTAGATGDHTLCSTRRFGHRNLVRRRRRHDQRIVVRGTTGVPANNVMRTGDGGARTTAQTSGLPGVTFANPLNRNTTDAAEVNRTLACGDAPSISGKSCDEYPLKSTYQGLAYGGSRRTFAGCNVSAPTGVTGPTGTSACVITASENNAQGGIRAKFNYDNRVLNGDPFLVNISS